LSSHINVNNAQLVEFYFSDSNLPYDKFMWTLHTASPEHWVPLATVSSFKRARELTGAKGIEWVAAAVRARSQQLEVDEAGAQVRRKTEVTEPKDQFERSVYAVRIKLHRTWIVMLIE
jgi:lupus La protein